MDTKTFTQEELNSIVGERLNKEKDKFSSQISELEKKVQDYESQIANLTSQNEEMAKRATTHQAEIEERDAKLRQYETQSVKMRVAREHGIPYELANRLSGETEEDIKKDAEFMSGLLKAQKGTQPLQSTERDAITSNTDAALRELAAQISKK